MADTIGTLNHINLSSPLFTLDDVNHLEITNAQTTIDLSNVVLPDISDSTIVFATAKLVGDLYAYNETYISGDQYIEIKKSTDTWGVDEVNAILVPNKALILNSSNYLSAQVILPGSIDISGKVDAFDTTYNLRWKDAECTGSSGEVIRIYNPHLELDIWFTQDSGVEDKIDTGALEQSEIQSEVASHVLERSTVSSELQSKVVSHVLERSTVSSELQSKVVSHALERSTVSSELQSKVVSHALEVEIDFSNIQSAIEGISPGGDVVQSELASHVLALSEIDSELQSKIVSHAGELATEVGYTQSEIASHVLERSTTLSQIESSADLIEPNDSETQSEVASHALQNSVIDSEAVSALAERDIDLSTVESSANLIEPGLSEVQSVVDEIHEAKVIRIGSVSGDISTTQFETNLPEDDDHWNGLLIRMTDGSLNANQVRRIIDFADTDGVVTVDYPFEVPPEAPDEFYLMTDYSREYNYDEETESEIASHALANSTAMSEANSALEERDIDLSTVESSTNLIEPEFSNTQSEIASHALENSTIDSQVASHIEQHDTDIKALVNVKATPEFLVVPPGVTRINVEGGVDDVVTTIPIYDSAQFEDEGIVYIGTELITYTGITDGSLTGCTRGAYSTVAASHADQAAVYEVVNYPLRLMTFDNENNMVAPDSAPTIEIVDWYGNQELAPTAMTEISTGLYGYNYLVYSTNIPEPKTLRFSIVIDGVTTLRQSTLMILDKPVSTTDLIALVGGGNGEFAVTQDGWYDNDGIFTAWTDVMAGYLRDSTSGSRLDDVLVTAYEVINGTTIRAIIPPGQTVCDSNGNYEMRLDAGTYIFKFYKDQYRFPTDEVERVIT